MLSGTARYAKEGIMPWAVKPRAGNAGELQCLLDALFRPFVLQPQNSPKKTINLIL